ncbi:MAG: lysozyme inhibitor LprI family protein [Rhizobiaceae bacterium]
MPLRAMIVSAVVACVWASGAMSQDEVDCDDPITQSDMNQCAAIDYEEADAELNATWKEARAAAKALDEEQPEEWRGAVDALVEGQRGWIAYRDGACELYGFEARGGSMESMLVSGCKATMTRARTKELREFVDGPQ